MRGTSGGTATEQPAEDPAAVVPRRSWAAVGGPDAIRRQGGLLGRETRLKKPTSVACDDRGGLYVADSDHHAVRYVRPNGMAVVVAGGNGRGGPTGARAAADEALAHPTDVAVDAAGNLVIADRENDRILLVDPHGAAHTLAGGNGRGYAGDGGPATEAVLFRPRGVAVGPDGGVWFTDRDNSAVRRIDPDGTITTAVGGKGVGYTGDGGPATRARLRRPRGLAFAPDGTLHVADRNNHAIRRIDHDGTITTVAGGNGPGHTGDGGPAADATFDHPSDLCFDDDGAAYVTDHLNDAVRRIDPDGTITTVAGGPDSSGDDRLTYPSGIDIAPDGTLFVAAREDHVVRAIAGVATTAHRRWCDVGEVRRWVHRRNPSTHVVAWPPVPSDSARRGSERRWAGSPPTVASTGRQPSGQPLRHLVVFGCERSGTTALTHLLSAHPAVVVGTERYKYLVRNMRKGKAAEPLTPGHLEPERFLDFRPTDTNHRPDTGWDRYDEVRDRIAGDLVWYLGDKILPAHPDLMDQIAEVLPTARYLFIYRDPMDVLDSFERRARDPRWPRWPERNGYRFGATHWLRAAESLEIVRRRLGARATHVVRHEDLYSAGRRELHTLFDRLGLAMQPGVVERHHQQHARLAERGTPAPSLSDEARDWIRSSGLPERCGELDALVSADRAGRSR